MRLFEIDDGGATWWVAAKTEHQALAEWAWCLLDQGASEELKDALNVYEIKELGQQFQGRFSSNSDEHPGRLVLEVLREENEVGVMGCSEWP